MRVATRVPSSGFRPAVLAAWGIVLLGGLPRYAAAQQTVISTPLQSPSASFYEHFGLNFGYSKSGPGGGMFFNNGGGGAVPPFGGFDPAAGANFGVGGSAGGGRFFLGVSAGQGSTTSSVSQSPSITVMNGQIGTITDTVQTPFVTSIIPIVGEPVSPLKEKLARLNQEQSGRVASPSGASSSRVSSTADASTADDAPLVLGRPGSTAAQAPALSVSEIQRRQQAEDAARADSIAAEIEELIGKGRAAEQAGKPRVARIYYQMAASRASGQQKAELLERAKSVR